MESKINLNILFSKYLNYEGILGIFLKKQNFHKKINIEEEKKMTSHPKVPDS